MAKNIYLGIGSNLGCRIQNFNSALKLLRTQGTVKRTSFVYKTVPLYNTNQDYFLNAVLHYQTDLPPFELLSFLKTIEKRLGRVETSYKGPRTMDLDILFYEDLILNAENLKIPHQGVLERDFVLKPFLDINREFIHPIEKKSVQNLYENILKNQNIAKSNPEKVLVLPKPQNQEAIFNLGKKTLSMGIFNLTPNSFYSRKNLSAEKKYFDIKTFQEETKFFDIIDIGGEATNVLSKAISSEEEISRLLPLFKAIQKDKELSEMLISLDTRKADVLERILKEYPISIINDISAGGSYDPRILDIAADSSLPYILMHSKGIPENMDSLAHYQDVVEEILTWFKEKIEYCMDNGINRWNIIIDPGFGFAKTIEQNIEILKNLQEFKNLGFPLLVGFSNKRFLKNYFENIMFFGNSSAATIAIEKGANIIRIHDKEISKTIFFADQIYKKL